MESSLHFTRGGSQWEEAITLYEEAIPLLHEAHDRHGEAQARHNRGDALQQVKRFSEAIDEHRRAADFFQKAKDHHHLAGALASLAGAYSGDKQHTAAAEISTQAVEIQRQLTQADPAVNAPELARTLCLASWVRLNGQHDLETARTMAEESVVIYRELGAETSPVLSAHFHMTLGLQADILVLLGRHQQADAIRREGLHPRENREYGD